MCAWDWMWVLCMYHIKRLSNFNILIYSIFHSLSCWVAYFFFCTLTLSVVLCCALPCPTLLSKDEEKKIRNHVCYWNFLWKIIWLMLRTQHFFFAVDVVGTCHRPIFVSLSQFVCLSVSVLDIVCYYFQPYFFFWALLAQSLASNRKRTKLFRYFYFDFASRNISFSFSFYNLMVNEALVYKHTNTHTQKYKFHAFININLIISMNLFVHRSINGIPWTVMLLGVWSVHDINFQNWVYAIWRLPYDEILRMKERRWRKKKKEK